MSDFTAICARPDLSDLVFRYLPEGSPFPSPSKAVEIARSADFLDSVPPEVAAGFRKATETWPT